MNDTDACSCCSHPERARDLARGRRLEHFTLGLNALFGRGWADPVAALVMVPIISRQGLEAWRGEKCEGCC